MKIEVDTKHDSREELSALADMLQRLSRSSGSGVVTTSAPAAESKPKNIFEDSSPSVGLFNMFDDSPSTQSVPAATPESATTMSASEPASPAPVQNQPTGGLFSLFSDDPPNQPSIPEPTPEITPTPSMSVPSSSAAEPTVAELLSGQADIPKEETKPEGTTSVNDILDDDRIRPY